MTLAKFAAQVRDGVHLVKQAFLHQAFAVWECEISKVESPGGISDARQETLPASAGACGPDDGAVHKAGGGAELGKRQDVVALQDVLLT